MKELSTLTDAQLDAVAGGSTDESSPIVWNE